MYHPAGSKTAPAMPAKAKRRFNLTECPAGTSAAG
jgi:hypothetical protein